MTSPQRPSSRPVKCLCRSQDDSPLASITCQRPFGTILYQRGSELSSPRLRVILKSEVGDDLASVRILNERNDLVVTRNHERNMVILKIGEAVPKAVAVPHDAAVGLNRAIGKKHPLRVEMLQRTVDGIILIGVGVRMTKIQTRIHRESVPIIVVEVDNEERVVHGSIVPVGFGVVKMMPCCDCYSRHGRMNPKFRNGGEICRNP